MFVKVFFLCQYVKVTKKMIISVFQLIVENRSIYHRDDYDAIYVSAFSK